MTTYVSFIKTVTTVALGKKTVDALLLFLCEENYGGGGVVLRLYTPFIIQGPQR